VLGELAGVAVDGESALTGRGDALAEQIELGVIVDHHRPRGERRAFGAATTLDSDPAAGKFYICELEGVGQV
jgi:hypothetical protein